MLATQALGAEPSHLEQEVFASGLVDSQLKRPPHVRASTVYAATLTEVLKKFRHRPSIHIFQGFLAVARPARQHPAAVLEAVCPDSNPGESLRLRLDFAS